MFQAIAGPLVAVAGGLVSQPPKRERKTVLGKFFQGLTSEGALPTNASTSPANTRPVNQSGVSGSIQFGQNQRLNILPFAVVAGLVAIIYFIFGKKKRRR